MATTPTHLSLLTGAALVASVAMAQQVVLTSEGGELELTGRLISFENGSYQLETSIGPIEVSADGVTCTGDACPELERVDLLVNARIGATVEISTETNQVQVIGRLLSFENQVYTVETKLGSLELPADGTRCEGEGCPERRAVPRAALSADLRSALGLD